MMGDKKDEKLYVCSATHSCQHATTCNHAKAHKHEHDAGYWRRANVCYDSKLLSACIPLDENGEYESVSEKPCVHCGGSGKHVTIRKHKPFAG